MTPPLLNQKSLLAKIAATGIGLFIGMGIAVLFGGCASTDKSGTTPTMTLPDPDAASQADGAAFTADSMHFRKPMPSHSDWRPMEFYFKHCSEIGEEAYFSKTSYECTTP